MYALLYHLLLHIEISNLFSLIYPKVIMYLLNILELLFSIKRNLKDVLCGPKFSFNLISAYKLSLHLNCYLIFSLYPLYYT